MRWVELAPEQMTIINARQVNQPGSDTLHHPTAVQLV